MKFQRLHGVLALSLASMLPAFAQNEGATTPPVAVEPAAPAAPVDPATAKEHVSYGVGYQTGLQFAQRASASGITTADIDSAVFLKGFMAAFDGKDPEVTQEKFSAAMQALGNIIEAREKEIAAKNLEAGKKFLEENGKREGVVTNKSGLQYEVITAGTGEKYVAPKEGEPEKEFMVNYRGTLIDGTEFDKSPEGQSVPMTLQVIEGFKEALTTMPVGSKWKIFVPGNLAYGEQRRSAEIAPNSTLIFELELVSIKDAKPQQGGFPLPVPQGQ